MVKRQDDNWSLTIRDDGGYMVTLEQFNQTLANCFDLRSI